MGKSSLFNRLLEQDRAIVTDLPGDAGLRTSRKWQRFDAFGEAGGMAGIREGEGLIEGLGIERSFQAIADADLTLVVVDLSAPLGGGSGPDRAREGAGRWLLVGNKRDLPRAADVDAIEVSALTSAGIEELRAAIAPQWDRESGFITSLRHEQLLRESLGYLEKAAGAVRERIPHEMLLLDLYGALTPIDAITGATTADDILVGSSPPSASGSDSAG